MKFFLFMFLLSPFINFAQANLPEITRTINSGDADALGRYFDQSVEIAVLNQEDVYNKAQAIQVLKDFFAKNQPRSFSKVHEGTSKAQESQYCIGNLVTSGGAFRVYIYMKVSGNNFLIQELRFDKE